MSEKFEERFYEKDGNRVYYYKWIDVLDIVVNGYNNKIHSFHGLTPTEGRHPKNQMKIYNLFWKNNEKPKIESKFNVGDNVRIRRYKEEFEKSVTENWTREIFVIDKVLWDGVYYYKLKDMNGEDILGTFYDELLMRA